MKGVHYLASAFSQLVAGGAHASLTVLGGGLPAESILPAFAPGARSLVTVIDRLPEEEVMTAYRAHDVMAFPSSYEGFGMVLLEALSQRLPVVTTPVGCATTAVEDGHTGVLVPPRDGAALADALARLLADPARRRALADAAFARVRRMTWTETARATADVYERTIAARPAFAHA